MSLVSYFSGASEPAALLRDCASGAVLIAAVWVAFRLLPRVPAAARCMVWWLLCLKMLVGLVWLAAPVTLAVLPSASLPQTLPRLPMREEQRINGPTSPRPSLGKEGDRNPAPITLAPPASGGGGGSVLLSWTLFRDLWLGGVSLFLMLLLGQFVKAAGLRRDAQAAPPGRCWEIMTAAAKALGVTPRPQVLVSLTTPLPMTAGLFHPVVLLPGKDAFTLTDDEMLMVLAHETAHIRRRDLWFGLIPALAQAAFFFHPLVWLAYREYLLAREEACDALALRAADLPADHYGRLLLRFGTMRGGAGAAVAITGSQAVRALRRRLAMLSGATVLTARQRWAWSAGLSVFGILCVIPVALTERAALSSQRTHLPTEAVAIRAQLPTRRLMLRTVAPDVLKRTVEVADARLATTPDRFSAHVAQAPVEIRELPSGHAPLAPTLPPAPPSPLAPLAPPSPPAPRPAPAQHIHVTVPPIAPLHVHVAPIHVHVPEVSIDIPDINVDVPAMPGFSKDFTRDDRKELSANDQQEFFRHWKGTPLTDKDMQQLLRQWKGTLPQSRQWEKNLQGLVRQQSLDEAKRDREDVRRDKQEALRESEQDAADAREEATQDAAEARQEAQQDAAEARREAQQDALDAQREARDEAAQGLQSAHESLAQAEAELRQEMRDNTNGVARQALQQALICLEKSRKALPKSHGDQ